MSLLLRALGIAATLWVAACASSPNPIASYLDGAECQYESDDQRAVIEAALEDMLTLSGEALRARRYRDYGLTEEAWSAVEVIHHYFVPAASVPSLDEVSFYGQVEHPDARKAIRARLDALRSRSQE